MGSGFSKMKKQARLLEEQYSKMRDEMKNTQYTGSAGSNLVTVSINGEKEIISLSIKPECVSDLEALQDLIVSAAQEAYKKADANSSNPLDELGQLPFSF